MTELSKATLETQIEQLRKENAEMREELERFKDIAEKSTEYLGHFIDGNDSYDLDCSTGVGQEFCQEMINYYHGTANPITNK